MNSSNLFQSRTSQLEEDFVSIKDIQERKKQISLQQNDDKGSEDSEENKYIITSAIESFRKCSLYAYDTTTLDSVFVIRYRDCIQKNIPNLNFDKFKMGRFNETKVFLPMKSDYDQTNCNWLTVGIGGDTRVEKEFKEKYPGCKVYGVEASPDQYLNFADYGTIIPFGVAVTNGSFELTIRKSHQYVKKDVTVLAMANLLDQFIGTRIIHYMTIDIEGFEYSILEQLPRGKILAEQGIIFCQIDAELHHFKKEKTKIKNFLHQFDSENSDYIPVYSAPFLSHQKITFVNFKNKECLEAFDFSKLY